MTRKKVFITGAAGFIGFHLALKLAEQGEHVVGYDNFNDYYDPQLKRDRAAWLCRQGITVQHGDIQDEGQLRAAIFQHHTTHLIHLAAQAGVRFSLEQPRSYLKSNVDGFLNVLEICRERPTIKLIYASSSSVYGLNRKTPFSIEDSTDQQASLYGVTKKTNELMAQTYHHLFGISVTGLRFFTVYGPWGRPDMAYFSFAKAIMQDKPIDIFNHGNMSRDFTYIDDIVDGIIAAMHKAAPCALYNLGHHHPEQLSYLVALLERNLGKKALKILRPMQPGDVLTTYADIEKSIEDLHFHPKVTLEEGIAKFASWFNDYYHLRQERLTMQLG